MLRLVPITRMLDKLSVGVGQADGEDEPVEFSYEDQNQMSAAYLTQVLDLEAQVEELSVQLEQQSTIMEEMKSDLTYYRCCITVFALIAAPLVFVQEPHPNRFRALTDRWYHFGDIQPVLRLMAQITQFRSPMNWKRSLDQHHQ